MTNENKHAYKNNGFTITSEYNNKTRKGNTQRPITGNLLSR